MKKKEKEVNVIDELMENQIQTEIDTLNSMPPGEDKLNQAKVVSELVNSKKTWTSSLLDKMYKKKEVVIAGFAAAGGVLMGIAKFYEVKARKDTNDKVLGFEDNFAVTSKAFKN